MTDYNVGVLRKIMTPASERWNAWNYDGVLSIDGKLYRWKACPARDYVDSSGYYDPYSIRVDLAEWRKRKDADAIRTAIGDAMTAGTKLLQRELNRNRVSGGQQA